MSETFTAFRGVQLVARGDRAQVALALADLPDTNGVLIFSDRTGRETDLDLSGGVAAIQARYAPPAPARGRGRPRLGVTAREITLLPEQWDWLAAQRGGASAALRRLIDAARTPESDLRLRQDAAYRFCAGIAGDLPGFEEAMRALYAGGAADFTKRIADWPPDIREHAKRLAALP